MQIKTTLLFFTLLGINLLNSTAFAQSDSKEKRELIQFSGVIVTGDSLNKVPYVNIIITNSNRGTISDFFGYFSFVAQEQDTIQFSAVGFKKAQFVIPDSLSINRYSLIQLMVRDTILLPETFIYPWPTKEQFRQAFMNLNIPDDDLERAKKNLELAEMRERYKATGMDASMNFTNAMQEQSTKLYYAGQNPPIGLLNPIAWVKFIEAWKKGELKIEK